MKSDDILMSLAVVAVVVVILGLASIGIVHQEHCQDKAMDNKYNATDIKVMCG